MQADMARLRRGGADGVFFAAYVPARLAGPAAVAVMIEQIDLIRRVAERDADTLAPRRDTIRKWERELPGWSAEVMGSPHAGSTRA
jgi:hypothetical protein